MIRTSEKKVSVAILTIVFAVILPLIHANSLSAGEDSETLFGRGITGYRQEQFNSARADFETLIESFAHSPRVPAAYVMLSKTLYRLGLFEEADSVAGRIRVRFPGGPYTEWAHYMEAACALRTGNVAGSLSLLAWLSGNARDERIVARSMRALRYSVAPFIEKESIDSALVENGVDPVALEAAEPYNASDILEIEDEMSSVRGMPARGFERHTDSIRIGLLAPLSGANAELGGSLLRGVRAAFSETKAFDGKTVELIVEDTLSDPVTTVLKVRELASRGVIAIVGPVYSLSSITAAVESNALGIPFVAPTATDAGLADIGDYVFQLNFNPVVQGEALADFAAHTLSAKHVAVIASRDPWGDKVAKSFLSEAEKLGVKIVHTAYFSPDYDGEEDIGIVHDIRLNAPGYNALADSVAFLTETSFADSSETDETDNTYYSSQIFNRIDTIDAILISATPSDAVRFASRIMEYNLQTALLGDSGWNAPSVPEDGKQFIEGAFLVAPPGALSRGSGAFFMGQNVRGDNRDIVAMKGYDAGAALLHCLKNGARNSHELAGAFKEMKEFQASSSLITIDPDRRVNTAVEFVRIHDRNYQRIARIRNVDH